MDISNSLDFSSWMENLWSQACCEQGRQLVLATSQLSNFNTADISSKILHNQYLVIIIFTVQFIHKLLLASLKLDSNKIDFAYSQPAHAKIFRTIDAFVYLFGYDSKRFIRIFVTTIILSIIPMLK